jgi:CTP:molybdopterin cytidylyltransferase MocA
MVQRVADSLSGRPAGGQLRELRLEPDTEFADQRLALLLAGDPPLSAGDLRRLRAEANPGGLNSIQVAALPRLEENDGMPIADHACAQAMKPHSMSAIIASTRSR